MPERDVKWPSLGGRNRETDEWRTYGVRFEPERHHGKTVQRAGLAHKLRERLRVEDDGVTHRGNGEPCDRNGCFFGCLVRRESVEPIEQARELQFAINTPKTCDVGMFETQGRPVHLDVHVVTKFNEPVSEFRPERRALAPSHGALACRW